MITLSHDNLENYYNLNFSLMTHWNWSLTEIENMLPFEREIYVAMLLKHVKEEKAKQEAMKAKK